MPMYEFCCTKCSEVGTLNFRMEKLPAKAVKCPACGKRSYSRVFGVPNVNTSKTVRTFGQQAERNMKAIGNEGMDFIVRQDKRERWESAKAASEEVSERTGGTPTILPKRYEDRVEDKSLIEHVKKYTGDKIEPS